MCQGTKGSAPPVNRDIEPKKPERFSPAAVTVTLVLLVVYVAALYFRVATASINDSYQPGIEAIRRVVSPGIILALLTGFAAWTKGAAVIRVSIACNLGALVVCGAILVLVNIQLGGTVAWQFMEERTLASTFNRALFTPSFSNRSIASALSSAVFAIFMLLISLWLRRKWHNNAMQATANTHARDRGRWAAKD